MQISVKKHNSLKFMMFESPLTFCIHLRNYSGKKVTKTAKKQ